VGVVPADLRCGLARHQDIRVALLAPGLSGEGLHVGDVTGALRGDGLSGSALRGGGAPTAAPSAASFAPPSTELTAASSLLAPSALLLRCTASALAAEHPVSEQKEARRV